MEWWGWVAWALSVSAGAYGAWRSWRTDRSLKLLGKKWEFVPDGAQQDMYLLANRMPRTARNIEVAGPMGKMIDRYPETDRLDLGPNEEATLYIFTSYDHEPGPMVVTWSHRRNGHGKRRTWRGHLPSPIAPSPFQREK